MSALCAAGLLGRAQERDSLLVMFWNVENFFDWTDQGTGESDREFSSCGERRWTKNRFYAKCDAVAKTFMWTADRCGRMPDVIGLAEVENRGVLTKLLSSTLLRKFDYGVVHQESGDRRGIDVALMYRSDVFEIVSRSQVTPLYDGNRIPTRDILCVKLRRKADGRVFDYVVNHHPSKFGGSKESDKRREVVMRTLRSVCDSLYEASSTLPGYGGIIAMGDFNDTPDAAQFSLLDGALENACYELYRKGEGTIRYEGKWDLIDMFWVSPAVAGDCRAEILQIPFLMTRERKHPGEKPLRTYSGPRYLGGVSDHCPIILKLR